LEKIPEGERFSSVRLVEELKTSGEQARYFPNTETILGFLSTLLKGGDVVLIMSNGGFDGIHEKLLEMLSSRA
jgi:UDP-N-acetylmuramate: L-alanyl-gamma-D-glutamyl-meso-diaminopimelate ligase